MTTDVVQRISACVGDVRWARPQLVADLRLLLYDDNDNQTLSDLSLFKSIKNAVHLSSWFRRASAMQETRLLA